MTKSEHYQLDDDVVFDLMQHLIKLWKNGRDAFLNINCRGGNHSPHVLASRIEWHRWCPCLRKEHQSPHWIKLEGIKPELRLTGKKEDRKQKQAVFTHQKSKSKEVNAPFSSSAAPSPVSPKAATVIPVSMDKPSFQISDGSIKADESICEKQRMILWNQAIHR